MCPEHGYVGGIKVFFTTETPGEVDTWVGGGVKFRCGIGLLRLLPGRVPADDCG